METEKCRAVLRAVTMAGYREPLDPDDDGDGDTEDDLATGARA